MFGTQVQSTSGLYKERIVYLGQEIDDLVINQIISVMLFADAEDATKEQVWYLLDPTCSTHMLGPTCSTHTRACPTRPSGPG